MIFIRRKILITLVACVISISQFAWAENTPSLTALVYKKLIESQKAIDDKHLDTSMAILQGIADNVQNSPYDNAMIWHMLGYVHFESGNLKQSAEAFEKVFEFDIPASLKQSNHKILGQVYMSLNQYQKALPNLRYVLDSSDNDTADVYAMIAHCHYELKQFKSAATNLNNAIAYYRRIGKKPKEPWLNLLQASLAQMDDVEHRIDTIKLLLSWYPKREYWLALASAYAPLEKMDNYLAILSLARRKALLTSEAQYVSLASVYFAQGAPLKTAQVLEEGFYKGLVKSNVRTLRFLASAYSMAREYEKALTPLRQAAKQSKDGELNIMLGNALYQLARWQEASVAFEQGLEKGELKQTTIAWMLLGQSYLNLKQYERAIYAFEQAALDEDKSEQAQQWLKYVRYEQNRQEHLILESNPS